MKTGIRAGNSYKGQYKGYKDSNRWQKNKIKKLERRCLANPDDIGAEEALRIVKTKTYNRKKPMGKGWFPPQEHKLIKLEASDDLDVRMQARTKLAKLRDVYNNKRPSAIKSTKFVPTRETIPDQLYNIGLINEKRKNAANTGLGRVRRR